MDLLLADEWSKQGMFPENTKIETNLYEVEGINDDVCILLQAAIRLTFQSHNNTVHYNIPATNTTVRGRCAEGFVSIEYLKKHNTTFHFHLNTTTSLYLLHHITSSYPTTQSISVVTFRIDDEETEQDTSYTCLSHKSFTPTNNNYNNNNDNNITNNTNNNKDTPINNDNNNTQEYHLTKIELLNMRYQAFSTAKSAIFQETTTRCEEDALNRVIPVVVGVALVSIIIITILAFLFARHNKYVYQTV